jgi:hypothetical protein
MKVFVRQCWLFLALLLALSLLGCAAIGPSTVPRDRFEYSSSITESWKRQTLLNIVKMRYLDPPVFVDVGQIVAGYSLETAVSVGGQLSSKTAIQGDSLSLGGSGRFTDRPTITYTPLTGDRFVRGLMTPLPPDAVFFTVQSGWPADAVFFVALASINGLRNQETSIHGVKPADPGFLRALLLLREIQASGAVGVHVIQDPEKRHTTIITLRSSDISPETLAQIAELRRLLRLDPDAAELKLVFGTMPASGSELAVVTRSILHIMGTVASGVDVPAEHIAEGRATPGWQQKEAEQERLRLIRIGSSVERPPDAFAAVQYRDHWFWIDDHDLKSKRTFALMMLIFTLAETGEKEALPLITIPAQ